MGWKVGVVVSDAREERGGEERKQGDDSRRQNQFNEGKRIVEGGEERIYRKRKRDGRKRNKEIKIF